VSANITLIGRLAIDPELKATTNGKELCRLVVITSRSKYNAATSQWDNDVDKTSWQVTCWDPMAGRASRLRKGDAVIVTGRASQRTWDDAKTGEKRYAIQITADSIGLNLRWSEPPQSVASSDLGVAGDRIVEELQSTMGATAFDDDIPF
jgi:single-strand DNA-binding protein